MATTRTWKRAIQTTSAAGRLLAVLATAACAHATPVATAAIPANETPRLQAAMLGTCEVTATQKDGGERKEARGLKWTFGSDGRGSFTVRGGMRFGNTFSYRIEGRNVLMDGTYKAIRVDDWSSPTLKWFLYDISETYYCTKQQSVVRVP